MALTKNQNELFELLSNYNLEKNDVIGIFLILENTTKDYIGMIEFLKHNPVATMEEIYDKCDELAGIELTDEDIENLTEDDYILKDEDDE